jgi:hypothetical protein
MRRFAALALMLAACGPRAVLGHGASSPHPSWDAPTSNGAEPNAGAPDARIASTAPGERLLDTPIRIVAAPTPGMPSSGVAIVSASAVGAGGIVISRLPAPHRVAAAEAPAPRTIDDALALVGHRDSRQPLAFALAVATSLEPDVRGDAGGTIPAFADGPALVAWAREQGTFRIAGAPMAPGDLLVFDRAVENAPASLVGVALATDTRGVTAFLYLARGVVRVGHLDPARRSLERERQ